MVTNPEYMQEMMEVTHGLRGVPVIIIGSEVVRGFNREKIATLLGVHA